MITTVTNPQLAFSWNLAMSIVVDRGKLENPEKISSEQGRKSTTLKRKALMTLGPGFDQVTLVQGKRSHNCGTTICVMTIRKTRAW